MSNLEYIRIGGHTLAFKMCYQKVLKLAFDCSTEWKIVYSERLGDWTVTRPWARYRDILRVAFYLYEFRLWRLKKKNALLSRIELNA